MKFLIGNKPTVSAIRLSGVINSNKNGLSLQNIAPALKKAFTVPNTKAVAIVINSPGGSPVQSSLIGKSISRLSKEYKLPVFAFIEDVAASGGYWLACAANEIYADSNSIVGSIGVIGGGFGFSELIKKYGIERRIYTSGKNKAKLDPFMPENSEDVNKILDLQKEIHKNFIDHVKTNRGDRLIKDDEYLFNGDYWTGNTALELGLIDGIDDIGSFFRKKYSKDVKIRWIKTDNESWFKRILGFETILDSLINKVETSLMMNRFGG